MHRFLIFVCLLLSPICINAQFLPGVKHIEVISELKDSMLLLNKPDVDKINKVYFEKNKLDSVNTYKSEMIELLESKVFIQDSIITKQQSLLENEIAINSYLHKDIEDKTTQYEKQLRRERIKKTCWQTTTGIAVVGILLTLILQ